MSDRICIKCGEGKELDDMTKDARAKDGRINTCKSCSAIQQKPYSDKYRASGKGKVQRIRNLTRPDTIARDLDRKVHCLSCGFEVDKRDDSDFCPDCI